MRSQSRRASAPLLPFSIRIFILKNSPRPNELQLNTTYTINTSEWHKSGSEMCHGNYFFLLYTTSGVSGPLRLCLHTWHVCLWGTMIHRAPHRYDGPFFILEKASRTVERDSANVCASSRVHSDPLEIGGDHNGACDVIPPDYFVILFASCVSFDPRKEFNSKLNILSSLSNRILGKKSNLLTVRIRICGNNYFSKYLTTHFLRTISEWIAYGTNKGSEYPQEPK